MVPTSTRRQSDAAYDQLRLMIIRTELAPGALIEEAAMMERLGVGRTPLREALFRLMQESLVENVPRRGHFVAQVSAHDFFSLFEIRRDIEALSARLAARRIPEAVLAALEALVEEARQGVAAANRDPVWNLEVDERFHLLVAEASGNPHIVEAVGRYYGLSVRALYRSQVSVALIEEELASYEDMVAALKAGDGEAAEAIMRRHLDIDPIRSIMADDRRETGAAARGDGQARGGSGGQASGGGR